MTEEKTRETINFSDYCILAQMINHLVKQGLLTEDQKQILSRRIAMEYELSPLYL